MTGPPDYPETIPELFAARAARGEEETWLRFDGDSWSFGDAADAVRGIAVGLASRGVVHGDRVAILLGNRPDTIFTWLAANRLGAIALPLNPASKPSELAGLFALTRPRLVVVTNELSALLETLETPRATPVELREGGRAPQPLVRPEDGAVMLATSGTTGAPKAVVQTHCTYTLTAEAFPFWIGATAADRFLCTLPLFHVNAQAYSTMGSLGCGAELALVPKFSASRFWDDVRRHRSTVVNAVGAMLNILLAAEARASDRGHGLRLCYAALALPEERHRAFEERFGVELTVGYGLSETTFGTVWPRGEKPYGTMGALRQHPRLGNINRGRVVRDDGTDAAEGETGEMWLANPARMSGYFADPGATAATFAGEWFRTGDLVRRVGTTFTFVSRKKEVLRRRGENVAAAEIELALTSHPSVHEAAVIGVAAPLGEDDIVAFVVPSVGAAVDVEALRAFVGERLADYKVPLRIHVRTELPRTATERVAKYLLRE